MSRFDWDRLRRHRPLDGAEAHVDHDGTHIWRPANDDVTPWGARRLRDGIVIRRRQERTGGNAAEPLPLATVRCAVCGARVSARKQLRHKRRCSGKRGAATLSG